MYKRQPHTHTPRSRSLGLAGRSWSFWVWVGSHNNWTGVAGCACRVYANANVRQTQAYIHPYLTIFAFGSDYFRSTSGAFGQLRDQGRRAGTRVWQVWVLGARFFVSSGSSGTRARGLALGLGRSGRLERVSSLVRAARGPGQAGWHSGLGGLGAWSAFLRQFGQLEDQGRWAGTRVWEVWQLGGRFFVSSGSSGSRGNRGLTGLALGLCVCLPRPAGA